MIVIVAGFMSGVHDFAVAQNQAVDAKKIKLPKPQDITLETKDGVHIKVTYFPGGVVQKSAQKAKEEFVEKPGKETVPVVLLHGFKGQRGDYEKLAQSLQRQGHAVIVPDLRGHGQSTRRQLINGKEDELDVAQMRPLDFEFMLNDVIAVKKFLVRENNAEKLNVEQLCVVGADMSALLALNWAIYDWNKKSLPSIKLGQDIKAVILLSPEQKFKTINANPAFAHPVVRGGLAVLIAVGEEDAKAKAEATTIHKRFERFHPGASEQSLEERDLFYIPLKTSLQGTKLFTSSTLPIQQSITTFINWRLVMKVDRLPWSKRENPLSTDKD